MLTLSSAAVTSPWSTTIGFFLLPAVVMVASATLAVWQTPGTRLRSALLYFAGGAVFSVVAVELLPDVIQRYAPYKVAIGFGLGVAVMLTLRYFTQRLQKREVAAGLAATARTGATPLPWSILVAIGVTILMNGLLLGIVFAAGAKEGALLAIALTIELLSLGLAAIIKLRQGGQGKVRAVATIAATALLLLVGAGIGTILRYTTGNLLEIMFSFGLVALPLLFLVTEKTLTEVHMEAETSLLTLAFFGGFLLFLLLGRVA